MADPEQWLGLIGHQRIVEMLQRAMSKDSLHHAILLSGPAGVGKKTLARALAAARLCPVSPGQGCGECVTCQRVLRGTHSDFVVVGPSGASARISRASVQESVLSLQQAPHEGPAHLTAFAPADRMSVEAANALLKTLEEPRPGVMLLLITQRPHAVLPTLRSRCLHLDLRPLTLGQTQRVLELAKPPLPTAEMDPLLELSPGQPGQILALHRDPSLEVAQACVQTMEETVQGQRGAAEIFGAPQSALWSAWEALVQASQEEPDATAAEENPVQKIGRSAKKSGKKATKKKAKKKSAAKKKPSAAQQRKALRTLSEVWLSRQRARLAAPKADCERALHWRRAQALMDLSMDIDRNINPRLLLERTLLAMLENPGQPAIPRMAPR